MMELSEPKCYARKCKHFIGVKKPKDSVEDGEILVCKAFPNGIPDSIAYGNNKHITSFLEDHGIQFEKENS